MTIRPVDMQVSVPKATEVSRIKSSEQNKNDASMQQQAVDGQKHANESVNRVSSKENLERKKIKEEKDKRRENQGKDNSKKGDKDETDEDNSNDKKSKDISVKKANKFEHKRVIDIGV